MTIPGIWRRLNAPIDGWFTAPETHAAGRTGLYRIIFSAFYLWHLSSHFAANLSGLPDDQRSQVLLVGWIERSCLSPLIFQLLESSLVAALVILMIGYRVPLATAAVLILGCLYESFFVSFSGERATTLLMFYIPLFALLAGRWGATYSLDAFIQRRTGGAATEPEDSSWCYFVPARAVLVVLAALFFSSGVLKVAFGANWLTIPGRFANIMLEANIKSAIGELPLNPLAPALAQMPTFVDIARYLIVLFESMFFLALFSRKLRNFFLSLALIFHSANALWFVVTFTPVLIVYGLFVDWQALRERLLPVRGTPFHSIAPRPFVWATLSVAAAAAILWNSGTGLRTAINFGGLLNWRTIWYPILPLSLVWCMLACMDLVRATSRTLGAPHSRRTTLPAASGRS